MRFWKRLNPDGTTRTVESYSHDTDVAGAREIDKAEYDAFFAALPPPPAPIDWRARFAAASTAVAKLDVLAERLGLK